MTDLLAKPTPLSFEEARTAIDDALIVHPKQVAECMDRMVGYQREYVKLVFLERLDKQVVAARLSKTPRDVYRSIGYPAVRRLVALIARALEPQPGEPEGVSVEQRSARLAELLAQPMPLGHEQARVLIEDALILHEDEVAKCIARMSGLQREYVRLSFLEHLGDEAVAARLGRTPREVYRLGEFPGVRRLATLVARELAMPSGGPGAHPPTGGRHVWPTCSPSPGLSRSRRLVPLWRMRRSFIRKEWRIVSPNSPICSADLSSCGSGREFTEPMWRSSWVRRRGPSRKPSVGG